MIKENIVLYTPPHRGACDIAIIGAGAAGLMAAIAAGRAGGGKVVAVDGAAKVGAKILVAGGGRCNVTHDVVDESAYAGSSRNAIRKVLGRFGVAETIGFFRDWGVELKREETGKLFPTTDDARTVLNALLAAARAAGVDLRHPWRVGAVERDGEGFVVTRAGAAGEGLRAARVVLATGGLALPKTGSDGQGYAFARELGHTVMPTLPALVPLTLARGHFLTGLSGITVPATLELRAASGKRLASFTDSTLLTHFGVSGPSVLDISRYYLAAVAEARVAGAAAPSLVIGFLPHHTFESLDRALLDAARATPQVSAARFVSDHGRPPLPERLARTLCEHAGVEPGAALHTLSRDARRGLAAAATELALPVTGDRGYTYAEVTAGGVPLSEINLATMESRVCRGLYLCGEICDVDGRIGGYNFQWAWASGWVAGSAAASGAA